MTEAEWLASTDPQAMLDYLVDQADECLLRQFTAECCRRVWHLLPQPNDEYQNVLDLSERLAVASPSGESRAKLYLAAAASCAAFAAAAAENAGNDAESYASHAIYAAGALTGTGYADEEVMVWSVAADAAAADEATQSNAERGAQAELLRRLLGNPFQPK